MAPVVDLRDKLSLFSEHWSPKVVATMNDYEVKVVKVKGEFVWHSHADTDELFLVVDGTLTIQLPDGDVILGPGQLFVVPRGVEHCPVAAEEASIAAHRAGRSRQHRGGRRRPDGHARHQPAGRLTPGAQARPVPLMVADPTTRVPS